ncbi:hypothetical protein H5410_035314 [Solanum commersonii]|uniref:Uncharacterized protein n=1 Tax=Solanum commersonii TaxID=4109 RepID=A0A9J5Y2B9_SOLCO|nr:hypothetical protein H5410_035314 [Solanum commersonii]
MPHPSNGVYGRMSSSIFPLPLSLDPKLEKPAATACSDQQQQLLRLAAPTSSFPLISLRLSFLSPFLFSFLSSLRRNTTSNSRTTTPAAGSTPIEINSKPPLRQRTTITNNKNRETLESPFLLSPVKFEFEVGSQQIRPKANMRPYVLNARPNYLTWCLGGTIIFLSLSKFTLIAVQCLLDLKWGR